jgi:molecular chaperone IbpA
MRHLDLTPLFRTTVGFDRLNQLLDTALRVEEAPSYPPYDIEKTGEDTYRVTMAVAGFGEDDVDVTLQENMLTVAAKSKDDGKDRAFLYRGIARRAFERKFQLADHIIVTGASLVNGLLNIDLAREVPEAMKPRKIAVATSGGKGRVIESKTAA